jgi:hypothetical protein
MTAPASRAPGSLTSPGMIRPASASIVRASWSLKNVGIGSGEGLLIDLSLPPCRLS